MKDSNIPNMRLSSNTKDNVHYGVQTLGRAAHMGGRGYSQQLRSEAFHPQTGTYRHPSSSGVNFQIVDSSDEASLYHYSTSRSNSIAAKLHAIDKYQ